MYLASVSDLNKDIYYVLVAAEDNGRPRLESVAAVYVSKRFPFHLMLVRKQT